MKKLLHIGLLLCVAATVTAQEKVLKVYEWKDLAGQIPNSQIISMDGMSVLKIENTNNTKILTTLSNNEASLVVPLMKITNTSIIQKTYWISCEIKYESVWEGLVRNTTNNNLSTASGVLELLAHLPPLASGGDESINKQHFDFSHTSNWELHTFAVQRNESGGSPTKLELKLSLPGHGTIYLRPIKLVGFVGSWWSPQQVGLIGGIGGSVIGCFGALLGLLASKGKARSFVLTTMKIFIALGILLTIAGFAAVVSTQPYAVWFALLLPGVILTLVFSLTLPSIQRRYDELEIRRMTSVDTMGS